MSLYLESKWSITLAGEPVPEGRPRARVVNGRFAQIYADPKSKEWRRFAAMAFREHWGQAPLAGPVLLEVVAVCKRPKRLQRKKDPESRMWNPNKPDSDNVLKAVMDALVEGGVMLDDRQVVSEHTQTLYVSKDEGPIVFVSLAELMTEGPDA